MIACDRLYGGPHDDERLHRTLDDCVRCYWETLDQRGSYPHTFRIDIYSVLPPGDSGGHKVMEAADIADHVIEAFGDECGVEELWDEYETLATDPDVIAAFQHARDVLVSKQTYPMADRRIDEQWVKVHADGSWNPVENPAEAHQEALA